jgi:hypothetical protein
MACVRRWRSASMARDPLDTLMRLRRLGVREQMRDLAAAIRGEEQADLAHRACVETVARETAEARSMAERGTPLAGFVLWHARAVLTQRDAETQVARARETTNAARALLGDARSAMRAVELAIDRRQAAADLTAQRSTQHVMDDTTRRQGIDCGRDPNRY